MDVSGTAQDRREYFERYCAPAPNERLVPHQSVVIQTGCWETHLPRCGGAPRPPEWATAVVARTESHRSRHDTLFVAAAEREDLKLLTYYHGLQDALPATAVDPVPFVSSSQADTTPSCPTPTRALAPTPPVGTAGGVRGYG